MSKYQFSSWSIAIIERKDSSLSKWNQAVFFFFLPLTIFNYYIGVVSATLLVAINEIRRSARAKGLSFYQYGMCHYSSKVCGYLKQDLFTSSCFIMETFLSLLPSWFPLFYWSIFSILVTNTFYKLGENLLI